MIRNMTASDEFNEPDIALTRVYTRSGDAGTTALVNGRRVRKDDPRVEAYGTVDELNACIGRARECVRAAAGRCAEIGRLDEILLRVQHELFNLGSEVATDPGAIGERQPRVLERQVERLESEMDAMNGELGPLESFVLPGGTAVNAELHVCRTVCRRAERRVVALMDAGKELKLARRYLNRLSDALFVWSRWACHAMGDEEVLWQPNATL